jgi:hypothetical protein
MSDDITTGLDDLDDRLAAAANALAPVAEAGADASDSELDARLAESDKHARATLAGRLDLDARLRRITGAVGTADPDRRSPRWPWRRAQGRTQQAETAEGSPDRLIQYRPRPGTDVALQVDDGPLSTPPNNVDGPPAAATPVQCAGEVTPVTLERVADALKRLDIRFMTDAEGTLLALWERHAVLFALEGPDDEILVIRARPHATVPPDWADRSYRVVNEWNHTRRFCKAYVGDPTDRDQLPIYAEMQVPLSAGVHDALLVELVDCAAAVAHGFVDWLHDEGALL